MLTVVPTGGMKITSPCSSLLSSVVSPRISRSYRSSERANVPRRFNWMLRSEPTPLAPPAAYRAEVIVPSPLMVYEPGRLASPRTNTRIERVSPIDTLARTPIICRCTRDSMLALALSKVCPPTSSGPRAGRFTRPSRPTVSFRLRFSLPYSCTLSTSPAPTM